jgi:hypothetical protein
MVSMTAPSDSLWYLLWSQAAYQIIEPLCRKVGGELVRIGYGWGLRRRDAPQLALLLYPSTESRSIGDLSLIIQGKGGQAIPRYGHGYPEYLAAVEDALTTIVADLLPCAN